MVRAITQLLVGLMLLFGVLTLFPKAYFDLKAGRPGKAMLSIFLGLAAAFFSVMAFYYAYLILRQ